MTRLSLVHDFWLFLRRNNKLWLMPIVIPLLLLGVMSLAAQGPLSRFIYKIF